MHVGTSTFIVSNQRHEKLCVKIPTEIFSLASSSKSRMKRKASYSHHFTDGWAMGKWRERKIIIRGLVSGISRVWGVLGNMSLPWRVHM